MAIRREKEMAKVLVLYESVYGRIEIMVNAAAGNALAMPGIALALKRVHEAIPDVQAKHRVSSRIGR